LSDNPKSKNAIEQLIATLDLERLEENLYRGLSPQIGWQRVFGGQVIAQALVAAQRTVPEDRYVHSLHAYFMRPGDPSTPIIYQVDRIRDGGSFTTRRVVAIQHGKAIFSLSASFQEDEEGFDHQIALPNLPMPENLITEAELRQQYLAHAPEPIRRYWKESAQSRSVRQHQRITSHVSVWNRSKMSGYEPRPRFRRTVNCRRSSSLICQI